MGALRHVQALLGGLGPKSGDRAWSLVALGSRERSLEHGLLEPTASSLESWAPGTGCGPQACLWPPNLQARPRLSPGTQAMCWGVYRRQRCALGLVFALRRLPLSPSASTPVSEVALHPCLLMPLPLGLASLLVPLALSGIYSCSVLVFVVLLEYSLFLELCCFFLLGIPFVFCIF